MGWAIYSRYIIAICWKLFQDQVRLFTRAPGLTYNLIMMLLVAFYDFRAEAATSALVSCFLLLASCGQCLHVHELAILVASSRG